MQNSPYQRLAVFEKNKGWSGNEINVCSPAISSKQILPTLYRFLQEGANCALIDKITNNLIKDVRTSTHAMNLKLSKEKQEKTRFATGHGNVAITFWLSV